VISFIIFISENIDYIPVVRILDFAPGQMTKTLTVTVLDDLGKPQLEGIETFELYLHLPVGGSIGEPSTAIVHINDTVSDCKFESECKYRILHELSVHINFYQTC